MNNFAKYINKTSVKLLDEIPNISNPSLLTKEEYASKNGFKPLVEDKPHNPLFYEKNYEEKGNKIIEKWVGKDLNSIKEIVLDKIQKNLNNKITERTVLTSETLDFPIIYDMDAIINIFCILIINAYGMLPNGYDGFIDANDNTHSLSIEEVIKIALTLANHRISLYTQASENRESLKSSTTAEKVEEIYNSI